MKRIISVLAVFTLLSLTALGQSFSIGATGGITTIQSPDQYTNDVSEGGLGFGSHPHYGLKAKLGLPLLPITVTGQVVYTNFSNEVNGAELEQSLLIAGAGIEYGIIPIPGPINPYLAVDVFVSNFGDLKLTAADNSEESGGATRTGVGVGAGIEITILPVVDIEASAKYNFNNLIGKEDGEESINTINISATIFYSLN